MGLLRSSHPDAEARAVRQINRFRSWLILAYLLAWTVFTIWLWSGRPPFDEIRTPLHFAGRIVIPAIALILVPLFQLFSVAVLGVLFRLRLPVWLACVVTCLLGPVLAVAFLVAALQLAV